MTTVEEVIRDADGNTRYVWEGSSSVITMTLYDAERAALSTASILTLTLTIYNMRDEALPTVINSRNATNILNTGIGTVADDGDGNALVTARFVPADNPNEGTNIGSLEKHWKLFTWTYQDTEGVTQTGKHVWIVYVKPITNQA